MKKISALLLFAAFAFTGAAQTVEPDTIQSISNANNLSVIREGSSTRIIIEGKDSEPDFYYSLTTNITDSVYDSRSEWEPSFPFLKERRKSRTRLIWGRDFYLGATVPLEAPKGLNGSIEVGLGCIGGIEFIPWRKGPEFSIGIGFHYRQYTLHNSSVFELNDHVLSINPVEADKVSSTPQLRLPHSFLHLPAHCQRLRHSHWSVGDVQHLYPRRLRPHNRRQALSPLHARAPSATAHPRIFRPHRMERQHRPLRALLSHPSFSSTMGSAVPHPLGRRDHSHVTSALPMPRHSIPITSPISR